MCARAVILPPLPRAAQFIICTVCERKMLAANRSGTIPQSVILPHNQAPAPTLQPPRQPERPAATAKASDSDNSRLTIRLPKSKIRPSNHQPQPQPQTQAPPHMSRKRPQAPPAMQVPSMNMPSVPSIPPAPVVQPAPVLRPVAWPSQRPVHQMPSTFANPRLAELRKRHRATEMNIEALRQLDHLNSKGETLFPQFLPGAKSFVCFCCRVCDEFN